MNYIVIIIGHIMESVIMYHYWFSIFEKRFSAKKTMVLFILANILNMARSLLLFDNLPLKAFTGQIYMSIMVMVLAKDRIGRKLVVYTSYTISTLLAEITGAFIAKYVYGHNLEQNLEFSFECFLWQGTVFFLIFVYTTVSLLFIKKKKINMDTEITKLVYLYVFLQSYVVFLFLVLAIRYGDTSSVTFLTLIFVMLVSVVVAFFIYRATKITAKKNAEAEFMRKQAKIKDKHFLELKEQYIDYRRLRHDFYNHIKIIDSLNDSQKIREYVGSIKERFDKMKQLSYCNNLTLDALLVLKQSEAQQNGIKVNFSVCDIDSVDMSDFDLCSVVVNLLDNAIEAAKKTKEKYLDMEINRKTDRLIIFMKNSSQAVSPNLKTIKNDKANHGLGIESIKAICEKYDGDTVFQYKDNEFISIVTMKCI